MRDFLVFGCGAFVGFILAVVYDMLLSARNRREEPEDGVDWWERM